VLHEQLDAYKTEGRAGRSSSLNGSLGYDDDYDVQSKLTFY